MVWINTLRPRILYAALLLSLLVALPHTLHLPIPVTIYFVTVLLWQFIRLRRILPVPDGFRPHGANGTLSADRDGREQPPKLPGIILAKLASRLWLILLTVAGVLLVYNQHQTLLGRDAGVSLLTVMLALKLLETRKPRDIYVVACISYFMVITQVLFNQAFFLAVYLFALVVCNTALLLEINRVTASPSLLDPIRRTLIIGLQALPIAAILFILFPRLSHPIW